jgi:hypothetical protein
VRTVQSQIQALVLPSPGDPPVPDPRSGVPPYLMPRYTRVAAAAGLGDLEVADADAVAALTRAAMVDEEDDVRKECLLSLAKLGARIPGVAPTAVAVLTAATFDPEDDVRAVALEELWGLDRAAARVVATRLTSDTAEEVADYAREVLEMP